MAFNVRERFKERKSSFKIKEEKNKKKLEKEENNLPQENQIKIIIFSPLIILGFIKKVIDSYHENKSNKNNSNEKVNCIDKNFIKMKLDKMSSVNIKLQLKENNINQISTKNVETKKLIGNSQYYKKNNVSNNNNIVLIENYQSIENKIFVKFKNKLIKLYNISEIIESEVYLISKYADDYDLLAKSQKIAKEIEILSKKIEKINQQYKLIKNNSLIENPLLLDDSLLIDDIIEYREKITKDKINTMPNQIKLLDEYNFLYTKLDELEIKATKLQYLADSRVQELSIRDEEYKKEQNKIINLNQINSNCNQIINKYNKYLEELDKKVDKIDEKTLVKYKLKGLDGLFSVSLEYIGLLALTPLRGLIPGISVRTIATRKLVNNMIKNIHYNKEEKVRYSIKNYLNEINGKIYDIDNVKKNIEYALSDVEKLKSEFHDYFFKYHLKEYETAYKKIEKIEKDIINNKQKINTIKGKMIKNKKANQSAMTKVRKLNS